MTSGKRRGQLVIGLAGKVAAGKTTIAGFLSQQFGFEHVRSRDILVRLLEDQGIPADDASLQDIGARIIKERGPHAVWELMPQAHDLSHRYVIDSLRYTSDWAFFREKLGDNFKLVFLVAPDEVRRERFLNRAGREASESGFWTRTSHARLLHFGLSRASLGEDGWRTGGGAVGVSCGSSRG
ncbi:MAG TPA: AAA family ATPase [Pseudonocardiaceae bacterium]|jgi:cytidylate kinase|nr:AAA family ATPase [Pseudonocardiaceae bacterium]